MKYAISNGTRIEAKKGVKAFCPSCNSELTAKCGENRVHHWAHKKSNECDTWSEPETQWHRQWKDRFPSDWQEIVLQDDISGERHVADIRTNHGLVIEFQHSPIEPAERLSREKFYKTMLWVVDGTQSKIDYPRFLRGYRDLSAVGRDGYFFIDFPDECFPDKWLHSNLPVIFDFKGLETGLDDTDMRAKLYCLLPKIKNRRQILIEISHKAFIQDVMNGKFYPKDQPAPEINQVNTEESVPVVRYSEPTHLYDPTKGKMIKRRRF